jgi:octaprenyl-diphosphate synthase
LSNTSGFAAAGDRPRPDLSRSRAAVLSLVAHDLQQVEALFCANLASPIGIVHEIGSFVAEGGGKRIRPALHLLCARLYGATGPSAIVLGTALEMLHCATLIHDDIVDEATLRRGRSSVHSRWGSSVTVLYGDYIFAKAMELALKAQNLTVMEKLALATLRMTEGEMLQTRTLGRLDLTREEYFDIVEKKTAVLFACCCELAGVQAGAGDRELAALSRYGRQLGIAFQIVDDLLDLTSDARTLGKPTASDLREGKVTLAVLELLASGHRGARDVVADVVSGGPGSFAQLATLTRMLQDSGAVERAYALAWTHATAAKAELLAFDEGPVRRALQHLPEWLLLRDR